MSSYWKSDPSLMHDSMLSLFEDVIVPFINGKDSKGNVAYLGPKNTIVQRYLLILYLVHTITFFRLAGRNIDEKIYFTIYYLWTRAKSTFSQPVKFDRVRTAAQVYGMLEKVGLVNIKHLEGDTFITLTEKGNALCKEMVPTLITLAKIHSIIPRQFEDYQVDENVVGAKKGKSKHLQLRSLDIRTLLDELVDESLSINQITTDWAAELNEDDV